MYNVIYSKYSNERNRRFQIRTDIIKNEEIRYVQKIALTQTSYKHLNNMYENYLIMTKNFYLDESVEIVKCTKVRDNILKFDYVEGCTLSQKISSLIENDRYDLAIDVVKDFKEKIENINYISEFEITDDFINIFGEIELPKGLKASSLSNIDVIFSNIILNDEKWYFIDYEWIFNFKIPINFILYRALFDYNVHNDMKFNENIYNLLGITDFEIILYHKMEYNFQRYVCSEPRLDSFYNLMKKKVHYRDSLIRNTNEYEFVCYVKCNDIYNEEMSIKHIVNISHFHININLDNFNNFDQIRIDPLNTNCVILDFKVYSTYNNKELNIRCTNADFDTDDIKIFSTNDPQIYIDITDNNITDIVVSYKIVLYDDYNIYKLINSLNNYKKLSIKEECVKLNRLLDIKEKELDMLNELLDIKEKELDIIKNRKIYKIINKINKI